MLNPKYHRYFALLSIATLIQEIAFSNFLSNASAQPETSNSPTQTITGGVRSPNSKCAIAKDNQLPDRVSLGEAKPFNTLPVRLQKIVAYSQNVGWVKADDVRKNVTEYQSPLSTAIKVLADFERLSLYGWGDLSGEGDTTEFCAFVETK
jgi:hypothetical protein